MRGIGTLVSLCALALMAGCASGDGVNPRDPDGSIDSSVADGGRMRDAGPTACVAGAACTTMCGTVGAAACRDGALVSCVPPEETCDGTDEDCDSMIDEGVADRTCTVMCGGGVSRCVDGAFSECVGGTPRPETCDGTDENCDGRIDEGLTRACTNACGTGVETCAAGVFAGCSAPVPRPETCDGTDENCDGVVDNGLTRPCMTACGGGTERCLAGAWVNCDAPAPMPELCSGVDEDCDGMIDEGHQATIFDPVPMADLTAQQPPCDGPGARLDFCMSAARRYCLAHPMACFSGGGAGHLQATPTGARIVCFGHRGDERNVSYATLNLRSSTPINDMNVHTRLAQSAVNRYCRAEGFGAGIGPTEHAAGVVTVTCLPPDIGATVSLPTSDLRTRGCDPLVATDGLNCSSASDLVCRDRGYIGGYGPVEWNATDSAVVCFSRA